MGGHNSDRGIGCIRLKLVMISHSNQATDSADNSVATRYGDNKPSRVSKKTGRVIAIIALIAAVAVTIWFAFSASSRMLSYNTVGYDIESDRSEEHTSELQSRGHLVCRLLLEKKKTTGDCPNRALVAS